MIKLIYLSALILISFISCSRQELSTINPSIRVIVSNNNVHSDTSLNAGKQYTIEIDATADFGENLTNLIVESNGIRVFDKAFNQPEIKQDIVLTKSLEEKEKLDIIIRNKARKSDTISLNIALLKIIYSSITRYNHVILDAQNSLNASSYLSFSTGMPYTQAEANNNQQFIDIIYYFDGTGDANTLASPGANLTGIIFGADSPENWTIRRTTRFSRLQLAINGEEFVSANNDSLILDNIFTDGGRKAKQLQNNQYYGFQTNESKYGILKVESVEGEDKGKIEMSLIIQN